MDLKKKLNLLSLFFGYGFFEKVIKTYTMMYISPTSYFIINCVCFFFYEMNNYYIICMCHIYINISHKVISILEY